MTSGTGPAIRSGDLLRAEGPFARAADDAPARSRTRCRATMEREGSHPGDGYSCLPCRAVVGAVSPA